MVQKLVYYITHLPDVYSTSEEIFKFPFVSSSFFTIEQSAMLKSFFDNCELLESLFEFLNNDEELLPVLCGYFSKACEVLMMLNPSSFLQVFYTRKAHVLLMNHIQSCSLAELLFKILYYSSKFEDCFCFVSDVIRMLSRKLSQNDDILILMNSQQVLLKFIQNSSSGISNLKSIKLFDSLGINYQNSSESNFLYLSVINSEFLIGLFENLSQTDTNILKLV